MKDFEYEFDVAFQKGFLCGFEKRFECGFKKGFECGFEWKRRRGDSHRGLLSLRGRLSRGFQKIEIGLRVGSFSF